MSTHTKTILDAYPNYRATIGIEVHVQLKTKSKAFCSCPNQFCQDPNTNICQVCTGHPGVLPQLNKKVVDCGILAGLATNCSIRRTFGFARKHYIYPDTPKNYQITQDQDPICYEGYLPIQDASGNEKKVRIFRIHMEEDAGKNLHGSGTSTWVDLNRAGIPLLEIVSYPDMESSVEAKAYLTRLHTIIRYLGISDANMEEGSFRADVNISVRPKDQATLGTKVELKNINSFRFIVHAIEFEIERQITMINAGEKIEQETRLWDSKQQKTIFMRSKEHAHDYRYFTEPDVPHVHIDDLWFETLKKTLPELPYIKAARFEKDLGLTDAEADVITQEQEVAVFFEKVIAQGGNAKIACNWILRDLLGWLKDQKKTLGQTDITPAQFAELVHALDKGAINSKVGQDVFLEMMSSGKNPNDIIKDQNLGQIDSKDDLEKIIMQVLQQNPDNVAKYKGGNERLFPFFVGQTMKATGGKGNPLIIQEILKKILG